MGVLLKTALLLALVGVAFGALQRGVAETHPDHPGKCWDKGTNQAYSDGQSWPALGQCAKYTCYTEGGEMFFQLETCGSVQAGTGCRLEFNAGVYPACCPSISCS
ncbi:U-scoloptoxin(16)-Er13a-like [Palaemon carinicauda]|uniref:U-scoloptoxin(16)-Er13a-like n=1 Tax=Palaemon carinicauda TaxID=392227 RepID=UPI0035B63375